MATASVAAMAAEARDKALAAADGITEALVPHDAVPHKPPLLANTKTNNYLLNALTSM